MLSLGLGRADGEALGRGKLTERLMGSLLVILLKPRLRDLPGLEAFNGLLREECLSANWFLSIADAQAKFEAWRKDYNESRPHDPWGT